MGKPHLVMMQSPAYVSLDPMSEILFSLFASMLLRNSGL